MAPILVQSDDAAARREAARRWLAERGGDEPVWIVAPTRDAAARLARASASERGAVFGWEPISFGALVARLAAAPLARAGLSPTSPLALEALVTRVVHRAAADGALGRFAPLGDRPGFPRALARTLAELRLAELAPGALEAAGQEDLGRLRALYEAELETAKLADRADVLRAIVVRASGDASGDGVGALGGRALVALDPRLRQPLEARVLALLAAGSEALVTAPRRDARSLALLREAFPELQEQAPPPRTEGALARLQARLFDEPSGDEPSAAEPSGAEPSGAEPSAHELSAAEPSAHELSAAEPSAQEPSAPELRPTGEGAALAAGSVVFFSAAGESRECVEVARRCLGHAREGVPFDRMAVVLRAPGLYRAHLVEAFRRARVPARFSRGTVLPDPSGRAFLALLACKAEGFSARAFAEYLSLGVIPTPIDGAPPPAGESWVAPDEELVPFEGELRLEEEEATQGEEGLDGPALAGTLRVPRHWESLLVDAAVIGGRERWARRLEQLDANLAREAGTLDPDDPRGEQLARRREELEALRRFALPLLDALDGLPEAAPWGAWPDALAELASRSLREPERVLQVLGELAPLGPVGPVRLEEVRLVLEKRLLQLVERPSARAEGVAVLAVDEVRGLDADVVFVPGIAEKVFPPKVGEDPLLLDAVREKLHAAEALPGELVRAAERVREERLALALAAGAATKQLVASWPRIDLERARPRVPSFYALELARAAFGWLPAFDELAEGAAKATPTVVGWPAPKDPRLAIDEAEFDLAVIRPFLRSERTDADLAGKLAYLHATNPHLPQALGFRARRWESPKWTYADGLVQLSADGKKRLGLYRPADKPYSPTALQRLPTCPYQFALYTFLKLQPREVPEAVEELDALQRGSLIHDIQYELLTALREAKLLPLDHPQHLAAARKALDETVDRVAAEYAEELAPAIPRVWEDAVDDIRQDLHEWLGRMHEDPEWVPEAFELAFGLRRSFLGGVGPRRDPASREEPVPLPELGLTLRGSIDLVERREGPEGPELRATDHKTGRVPPYVSKDVRIGGGRALQPLLYALALEAARPEGDAARVVGGRLYYCTSRGDFEAREVALTDDARALVGGVAKTLEWALERGFFPAAPIDAKTCQWCDYQPICGPHEAARAGRKDAKLLAPIERLREER